MDKLKSSRASNRSVSPSKSAITLNKDQPRISKKQAKLMKKQQKQAASSSKQKQQKQGSDLYRSLALPTPSQHESSSSQPQQATQKTISEPQSYRISSSEYGQHYYPSKSEKPKHLLDEQQLIDLKKPFRVRFFYKRTKQGIVNYRIIQPIQQQSVSHTVTQQSTLRKGSQDCQSKKASNESDSSQTSESEVSSQEIERIIREQYHFAKKPSQITPLKDNSKSSSKLPSNYKQSKQYEMLSEEKSKSQSVISNMKQGQETLKRRGRKPKAQKTELSRQQKKPQQPQIKPKNKSKRKLNIQSDSSSQGQNDQQYTPMTEPPKAYKKCLSYRSNISRNSIKQEVQHTFRESKARKSKVEVSKKPIQQKPKKSVDRNKSFQQKQMKQKLRTKLRQQQEKRRVKRQQQEKMKTRLKQEQQKKKAEQLKKSQLKALNMLMKSSDIKVTRQEKASQNTINKLKDQHLNYYNLPLTPTLDTKQRLNINKSSYFSGNNLNIWNGNQKQEICNQSGMDFYSFHQDFKSNSQPKSTPYQSPPMYSPQLNSLKSHPMNVAQKHQEKQSQQILPSKLQQNSIVITKNVLQNPSPNNPFNNQTVEQYPLPQSQIQSKQKLESPIQQQVTKKDDTNQVFTLNDEFCEEVNWFQDFPDPLGQTFIKPASVIDQLQTPIVCESVGQGKVNFQEINLDEPIFSDEELVENQNKNETQRICIEEKQVNENQKEVQKNDQINNDNQKTHQATTSLPFPPTQSTSSTNNFNIQSQSLYLPTNEHIPNYHQRVPQQQEQPQSEQQVINISFDSSNASEQGQVIIVEKLCTKRPGHFPFPPQYKHKIQESDDSLCQVSPQQIDIEQQIRDKQYNQEIGLPPNKPVMESLFKEFDNHRQDWFRAHIMGSLSSGSEYDAISFGQKLSKQLEVQEKQQKSQGQMSMDEQLYPYNKRLEEIDEQQQSEQPVPMAHNSQKGSFFYFQKPGYKKNPQSQKQQQVAWEQSHQQSTQWIPQTQSEEYDNMMFYSISSQYCPENNYFQLVTRLKEQQLKQKQLQLQRIKRIALEQARVNLVEQISNTPNNNNQLSYSFSRQNPFKKASTKHPFHSSAKFSQIENKTVDIPIGHQQITNLSTLNNITQNQLTQKQPYLNNAKQSSFQQPNKLSTQEFTKPTLPQVFTRPTPQPLLPKPSITLFPKPNPKSRAEQDQLLTYFDCLRQFEQVDNNKKKNLIKNIQVIDDDQIQNKLKQNKDSDCDSLAEGLQDLEHNFFRQISWSPLRYDPDKDSFSSF